MNITCLQISIKKGFLYISPFSFRIGFMATWHLFDITISDFDPSKLKEAKKLWCLTIRIGYKKFTIKLQKGKDNGKQKKSY